jgi:hypothetical protein
MNLKLLRGFLLTLLVTASFGLSQFAVFAQDAATPPAGATQGSQAEVQIGVRGDGQVDGNPILAEIKPGESADSKVLIGNFGADPLAVITYTADMGTRINGGLAMAQVNTEPHGQITWINYPTEELTIDPQKEVVKEFSVSVPDGTAPGEYVIPIAVETSNSFAVEGSEQLRQKIRKVITVNVTVPGDVTPSFDFGDPTVEFIEGGPAIQIPLKNLAQTTLRLTGELAVVNESGDKVIDAPIKLGPVYGLNESIIRYRLDSLPPAGQYQVSLSLTDNQSNVSNGFENRAMTMPEPPSTEVVPLAFGKVIVAPNADPIQFAGVGVEIVNNGPIIQSSKLTLIVTKDGQPLEEFVLADNLTLNPQGTTTITQRYLPITGWESGSYGFSLKLESVDPGSGAVSLLLQSDNVATIDVP